MRAGPSHAGEANLLTPTVLQSELKKELRNFEGILSGQRSDDTSPSQKGRQSKAAKMIMKKLNESGVDPLAQDLIARMLHPTPGCRITAREVGSTVLILSSCSQRLG